MGDGAAELAPTDYGLYVTTDIEHYPRYLSTRLASLDASLSGNQEGAVTDYRELESFSFGDSPALADEPVAIVLAGLKTATCSAVSDGPSTEIGKRMVMLDGSGRPLAVIETVELTHRRFNDVDAAFDSDVAQVLQRLRNIARFQPDDHRIEKGHVGRSFLRREHMELFLETLTVSHRSSPASEPPPHRPADELIGALLPCRLRVVHIDRDDARFAIGVDMSVELYVIGTSIAGHTGSPGLASQASRSA